MPRYEYTCRACGEDAVISHLSDETAEVCPQCEAIGQLTRMVSTFSTSAPKRSVKKKVGEITEEFIDTARGELKRQKSDLDTKR